MFWSVDVVSKGFHFYLDFNPPVIRIPEPMAEAG